MIDVDRLAQALCEAHLGRPGHKHYCADWRNHKGVAVKIAAAYNRLEPLRSFDVTPIPLLDARARSTRMHDL